MDDPYYQGIEADGLGDIPAQQDLEMSQRQARDYLVKFLLDKLALLLVALTLFGMIFFWGMGIIDMVLYFFYQPTVLAWTEGRGFIALLMTPISIGLFAIVQKVFWNFLPEALQG